MYDKISYDEIRFFQIPKALMENPVYRGVSMAAKLLYGILRDRQDLSLKNQWIDEDGYIYFYFDCRKLAKLCNVSTSTINRYKKELIQAELLINIRQGQGNPNRMYILKPESTEITLISHNDYTRVAENATLDCSKTLQSETQYNETEKSETENHLHHPADDGCDLKNIYDIDNDFIQSYLRIMSEFGHKHKRVREKNINYILDAIALLNNEMIELEDWEDKVYEHFKKLPKSNDGDILAFLSASKRYFEIIDLDYELGRHYALLEG